MRAPATTANLGPGFDCAAVALDLWNEVEIEEGEGGPGLEHLGVCAFALLAPVEGTRFTFTDRVSRERGLGSKRIRDRPRARRGLAHGRRRARPERLFALGLRLDPHADNLAAALAGGACLTCDGRILRVADALRPFAISLVPSERVSTLEARAALPRDVPHADAAFTAARAALLGAALASGSPELFAAALDDRLHEPYRAAPGSLLEAVRSRLPAGALGATLSGSGPTVIVWARPARPPIASASSQSGSAARPSSCSPTRRTARNPSDVQRA